MPNMIQTISEDTAFVANLTRPHLALGHLAPYRRRLDAVASARAEVARQLLLDVYRLAFDVFILKN